MNTRRGLATAAVALAVVGAAADAGLGAAPKKGGAYVGELPETSTRLSKRVVLKVSRSGKVGRARLQCASTRVGLTRRFQIRHGRFTGVRKTGSLLVWRLRGRFVSRTKARAKLYLNAVCDAKGGALTLTLK